MALKIEVYTDYVCPFCYLGKDQFEKAIKGLDVTVDWHPFELRPRPAPQIDPASDPQKAASWERYILPKAKEWNIKMKFPDVSPNPYTDLAHQGFHFANENGLGSEYLDRVFKAFFQESKNIGEISTLVDLAKEVGLDPNRFKAALESGTYKQRQKQALDYAYHVAHINSVPTYIVNGRAVSGAIDAGVLREFIENEINKNN